MQLPPNVEFWLRVAAVVVPAISAIAVALITYLFGRSMANRQKELNKELSLYQSGLQQSLNKDLENHKRDISRELENHRFQLQSDFQVRLHQFQTRFSWLHKERAEAIVKLYALVARVHTDLKRWTAPGDSGLTKPADEFIYDAVDHLTEMTDFFDQKRIFFDDKEIASPVMNMIYRTRTIYSQQPQKEIADQMIRQYITPLMVQLRGEFQKLLEAEEPTQAVERADGGLDSTDRRNT
jgi:hypothetical protein